MRSQLRCYLIVLQEHLYKAKNIYNVSIRIHAIVHELVFGGLRVHLSQIERLTSPIWRVLFLLCTISLVVRSAMRRA